MGTSRKYKNKEITKPRRIMGLALLTGSFLGVWLVLSGIGMGQVNAFSTSVNAQFVDVAAGVSHSLALRSDGTVVAWGDNYNGQCDVPALPRGLTYVEVSAGGTDEDGYIYGFSVARRSDGSVVAWGDNSFGQLNVPQLPPRMRYVEIATGCNHALARRSDGSVVAWGDNSYGQCSVPALPLGLSYVEISAGGWTEELVDLTYIYPEVFYWHRGHSVARRSDGSVVVWGDNTHNQKSVPALPRGITFVGVDAGSDHTVARLSDGSIVAWGDNTFGQCDVTTVLSPGLTYVAIDAGGGHTMALRSDGWLMAWGNAPYAGVVPTLPAGMTYVAMSVGGIRAFSTWIYDWILPDYWEGAYSHTLAIRSDGRILGWGDNYYGQANSP